MKKHIFYIGLAIAMFLWGLYNGYNRSNSNASQVHPQQNQVESVQSDNVAPPRDRQSNQRRDQIEDQMMSLMSDMISLVKQDIEKQVAQSKEKDYN